MGANQSADETTSGASRPKGEVHMKTCYYELLEVDRTASDEEYAPHFYRMGDNVLGLRKRTERRL
jgi:hypothetical protein